MGRTFSDTAIGLMLDALDEGNATGAKFLSAHSAYSNSGGNELTGGSPAYARKGATWGAAASAQKALSSAVTFDVPSGSTVAWIGMWDAVTAGNFLGMTPNGGGAVKAFSLDDTTADTFKCAGHGFANGDTVVLWDGLDTLPTGVTQGTVYFIVNTATNTFQLSATSGGAAINITGAGGGSVQKIVVETFAAQGTHQVSSMTLDGRVM